MTWQRWEYKIVMAHFSNTELELNELGKEGWELAACTVDYDGDQIHIFKRPESSRIS